MGVFVKDGGNGHNTAWFVQHVAIEDLPASRTGGGAASDEENNVPTFAVIQKAEVRTRDFSEVVRLCNNSKFKGWPVAGPAGMTCARCCLRKVTSSDDASRGRGGHDRAALGGPPNCQDQQCPGLCSRCRIKRCFNGGAAHRDPRAPLLAVLRRGLAVNS